MAKKEVTGQQRTILLIVDLIAARDMLASGGDAEAAAALIRDEEWRAVFKALAEAGDLIDG